MPDTFGFLVFSFSVQNFDCFKNSIRIYAIFLIIPLYIVSNCTLTYSLVIKTIFSEMLITYFLY